LWILEIRLPRHVRGQRRQLGRGAGARSDPADKCWIGLTDQIGIHGTSDLRSLRRADGRGVIFLGERDVEDVFDILSADSEQSAGSQVTIRR